MSAPESASNAPRSHKPRMTKVIPTHAQVSRLSDAVVCVFALMTTGGAVLRVIPISRRAVGRLHERLSARPRSSMRAALFGLDYTPPIRHGDLLWQGPALRHPFLPSVSVRQSHGV